jgi:hypothetical protein
MIILDRDKMNENANGRILEDSGRCELPRYAISNRFFSLTYTSGPRHGANNASYPISNATPANARK